MPFLGSPLLTVLRVLFISPIVLARDLVHYPSLLILWSTHHTEYIFLFSFFLFRFTFFLFPFFPLLCSFLLFMTHVCVLQRCCNLRDRIGWVFITCYAIIYKSILNADIDVTCDKLGYIFMYILLYQLNLSLSRI